LNSSRSRAEPSSEANALIGISDAMREVHKRIGMAAASNVPVLILGEAGTGKEWVARTLHRNSARARQPFVVVDCAAIPPDELEGELFGRAVGARPGRFQAADGGVLLLDEIGGLDAGVQAKIVRVLQNRELTPQGGDRPVKVDVRVIAATRRDLAAAVRDGVIREELMYRLDVLPIRLPALRERLADIIPLAEHFLRLAASPERPKALSASAAQRLLRHAWPGNVRELRLVIERSQALVRAAVIDSDDLELPDAPAPIESAPGLPADWLATELPAATERLERALIGHALAGAGGNRAEAARRLGIHRQLLYRKLAQYGLA
jgi:two-component system NtrC family response regulator